ncbi:multidrug permease ABC transporter [Bifidobacterium sp. DSM 109958]|uniref:Multidrug permease ABC transporter n=1 Tax=Bifidobacterium moraviense TaxID=2675323 RepID=A0A7Y0F0N0_9BIFI|nr:ABC transporter permease [Bifidobacterium sp. DSM 109958]NMM99876.1 multidrug permease ABC transporter [Bifidobacterium sp. DSM 109958]
MNTCKATVRVLIAHKLYIIIYLIVIGIMMLAITGSTLTSGKDTAGDAYDPGRATVAIVDRDGNRGSIAASLRAYLAADADMTDLADDPETLQQAVASNWVDLIVIIPSGYADELLASAKDGGQAPVVETVTSYTSGVGATASIAASGFLSLTRTELIGASAAQSSSASPDLAALDAAAQTVRDVAADGDANRTIAVDRSGAAAEGATSAAEQAASGFGDMIKAALYPLFLAMTVCTSLVSGVFNDGETRRRLFASPQRSATMGMQRMATLCAFALIVVAGYLLAAVALMIAGGLNPTDLPPVGTLRAIASACVYALMTVACGFLLGEAGTSDTLANGFANVFGLLLLFTSGATFPLDMIPAPMLAIGRMLPGWWYSAAIDDALGIGTAASGGADVAGWAVSTGIVALFAVAFVFLGLAAGRIRRSRPTAVAPAVTQLAEA